MRLGSRSLWRSCLLSGSFLSLFRRRGCGNRRLLNSCRSRLGLGGAFLGWGCCCGRGFRSFLLESLVGERVSGIRQEVSIARRNPRRQARRKARRKSGNSRMRVSAASGRLLPFRNALSLEPEGEFTFQKRGQGQRLDKIVKFLGVLVRHQLLLVSRDRGTAGTAPVEGVVHSFQWIDLDRPGLFAAIRQLFGLDPLHLADFQAGRRGEGEFADPVCEARLRVNALATGRYHE